MPLVDNTCDYGRLAENVRAWAQQLGFAASGISAADPGSAHRRRFLRWLAQGRHADMDWMERHSSLRLDPAALWQGTLRIISVRMDYLPAEAADMADNLADARRAYISRYALGRDYHKVLRGRLAQLAQRIEAAVGGHHRAFADSAPLLERAFAERSGLGWIGKNTMLIHREAGSWFFLGEICTDAPLPSDPPPPPSERQGHCGSCRACLDICPTGALLGPHQLDAGRCVSYLTIEHRGSIPLPLRELLGNRIFGCDDCQLACPWNRYARPSAAPDFQPRHSLDNSQLIELFAWSRAEFEQRTEGSAIRRAGYCGWLRNIAVALGNAPPDQQITAALRRRRSHPSAMVREHVAWALARQLGVDASTRRK